MRISISRSRTVAASRRSSDSGWTMIELVIVIAIIMILAAMALTQYRNSILYAKEAALRSDLFLMRDAIDQYYADKGKYPESLQSLVTESYLRSIPRDPFTNSSDTWTTTAADPQPGQLSSQTGVYEVKSGSDLTGSDGTRYADW